MPTRLLCQVYGNSPWVEVVRALSKFRKGKEFRRYWFTSSIKHETRYFHVVVVQKRQWNVQKSVTHLPSCCFAYQTTFSLPSPSYENQASGGRKVTLYFKCKGKINLKEFKYKSSFRETLGVITCTVTSSKSLKSLKSPSARNVVALWIRTHSGLDMLHVNSIDSK